MTWSRSWPLAAALFALHCIAAGQDKLAQRVDELLGQPHYRHAHWGYLFVDLATGETVLARQSEQLFAPASVTKLFSTAAALDALGADHRFRTPIHYRGQISEQGTLDGDLILVASGDLSFGGRTNDAGEIAFTNSDHTYANWAGDATLTPHDPLAGLQDLARQVAAAGLKKVTGDVLIDDRLFDRAEGSGSGPGIVTPIIVNDNVLDFTIEPTEPGQSAKVTWRPQTALFTVESKIETVREDVALETWIRPQPGGKIVLTGKIPANKPQVVRIYEVPDPPQFARALLIEALRKAGVEVAADIAREPAGKELPGPETYSTLPKIAEHISPPFAQSARLILKVSHNLHASTLPLLLAAHGGKRTAEDGIGLEGEFLGRSGVNVETISFGGGAGGARADYVTPAATVALLRHMAMRPDFAAYERALPILGVDGTLAKSCRPDSPAKGKVQAKTGTLVWDNLLTGRSLLTSKALAGYLTTAEGKRLAFAAFVNGVHMRDGIDSKRVGSDLGQLCEIVHTAR